MTAVAAANAVGFATEIERSPHCRRTEDFDRPCPQRVGGPTRWVGPGAEAAVHRGEQVVPLRQPARAARRTAAPVRRRSATARWRGLDEPRVEAAAEEPRPFPPA